MTVPEAIADIYDAAMNVATIANSAKGSGSDQTSADLQQANRKLQDALRMYEFVRR